MEKAETSPGGSALYRPHVWVLPPSCGVSGLGLHVREAGKNRFRSFRPNALAITEALIKLATLSGALAYRAGGNVETCGGRSISDFRCSVMLIGEY